MEYSPGLRGVVAGETAISTVGKEGTSLRYRGYDASELTKNNTYEDVASVIIKDSLDGDEFKEAFSKHYNNKAFEDETVSKNVTLKRGGQTHTRCFQIKLPMRRRGQWSCPPIRRLMAGRWWYGGYVRYGGRALGPIQLDAQRGRVRREVLGAALGAEQPDGAVDDGLEAQVGEQRGDGAASVLSFRFVLNALACTFRRSALFSPGSFWRIFTGSQKLLLCS